MGPNRQPRKQNANQQGSSQPRQNNPPNNHTRGGKGPPRRGGGGGRGPLPSVPSTSQVKPGASVSITLKQDQGTGREVQGKVQNLLTRGDHPRGIKVRLTDGRVGRVQRMDTGAAPAQAPITTSGAGVNAAPRAWGGTVPDGFPARSHQATPVAPAPAARAPAVEQDTLGPDVSLGAWGAAPPPKQSEQQSVAPRVHQPDLLDTFESEESEYEEEHSYVGGENTAAATCPICNDFEGDEAAVTHHVNSHFS